MQAGSWLQRMQERGQGPHRECLGPGPRRRGELGAGGAPERLHDHGAEGDGQEWREREQKGPPGRAHQGECGERPDHEVPLGHKGQRGDPPRRGLVDRLERAAALRAVVHAPAAGGGEMMLDAIAVEAPAPGDMSGAVVHRRPLALEESFGLAVRALLAKERSQRPAAMVPHQRRRAEADLQATLLQAPADVNVVTRAAKLRIEAAELAEH